MTTKMIYKAQGYIEGSSANMIYYIFHKQYDKFFRRIISNKKSVDPLAI